MILEDLKKGQQIYVVQLEWERKHIVCEFQEILSEEESLVKIEYNDKIRYVVVRNGDIVLCEDKISKIQEYFNVVHELEQIENRLAELKENKRTLRDIIF